MRQVTEIIQTSVAARASIGGLIVFPRPGFLGGRRAPRHIKSVALLRLRDGTVWMLVLQGQSWTEERLHAAAGRLARESKAAFATSSVQRLLRQEAGLRSLSVTVPSFDGIDRRVWEIDKVAFALTRLPRSEQLYPGIDAARPEQSEWAAREALHDGLREAVRSFVDAMDTPALSLATAGGGFDLRVYNYLAHRGYREYRLQFADTFPSLLKTAVVAAPASFGADLRSIVDAGAPLIKGLAARWGVRPGVIRHLVGRASRNVGFQWSRDAKGLALALDALHPQDMPGDSAAEWEEFNRIVVTGQRLFLQPIWQSAAGLQWLRACIRLSRRGDEEALAQWLPGWNDIDGIVRFRAALTEGLRQDVARDQPTAASRADTTVVAAADRAVLDIARQGLVDAATQFAEELGRARRSDRIRQIKSHEVLMPLIPGDFIAADGSTRVTALCSNHQLYQHGEEIRNCLRWTSAASMARKAPPGMIFIVGLYDAHSGKALSTAEIRAFTHRYDTDYNLSIRQHTARANRKPSARCTRTLRELLDYCQTDEVREHLLTTWRALRGLPISEARQPASLPIALRSTLGEQVYEGLVTSAREHARARDAGRRRE